MIAVTYEPICLSETFRFLFYNFLQTWVTGKPVRMPDLHHIMIGPFDILPGCVRSYIKNFVIFMKILPGHEDRTISPKMVCFWLFIALTFLMCFLFP